MVDFNEYMSVALSKCGSDRETFAQLVSLWNRQKEDIKQMNKQEVRQALECP